MNSTEREKDVIKCARIKVENKRSLPSFWNLRTSNISLHFHVVVQFLFNTFCYIQVYLNYRNRWLSLRQLLRVMQLRESIEITKKSSSDSPFLCCQQRCLLRPSLHSPRSSAQWQATHRREGAGVYIVRDSHWYSVRKTFINKIMIW